MGGRALKDGYGRTIDYMRVSVTKGCNLRCRYCMPEGCIEEDSPLSAEDILTVCSCGAELGIRHIRLTGGEPLLRKDCTVLVGKLKKIKGIETVTLTTNGILLDKFAHEFYNSGIDGVNVSLDTLDGARYKAITGVNGLSAVLKGIDTAERLGIEVKINSVIMQGVNEEDFLPLLGLARDKDRAVRFIELMPIGRGRDFECVSGGELLAGLDGAEPCEGTGRGPASYYRLRGYKGRIGFINPITGKFCDKCSRLRLDSNGIIRSCLAYGGGINIVPALREGREAVKMALERAAAEKPRAHRFEKGIAPEDGMYCIGG